MNACPQCHSPRRPHRVCPVCGTYAGREVVAPGALPRARSRPRRRLARGEPAARPRPRGGARDVRSARSSPSTATAPTSGRPRWPPARRSRRRAARACCCSGRPRELGEPPAGRRGRRRAGLDRQGRRPGAGGAHDARGLDRAGRARRRRGSRAGARVRRRHRRGARGGDVQHQARTAASTARRSRCRCPCPARPVTLLDVGANAEARREHLVQFAFMGAALARVVLGVPRPRVGLLSNGEEAGARQRAGARGRTPSCASARPRRGWRPFEFVGNVEGDDLVGGRADVIVTDGFTGNIALKLMEGVSQTMLARDPRRRDVLRARASSAGCCCARALRRLPRRDRPRGPGRRLPARPAPPRRRAARALHARRASRRRSCAPSSGAREDIVGQTHAALAAGGRAAGARRCPRRTLACRHGMRRFRQRRSRRAAGVRRARARDAQRDERAHAREVFELIRAHLADELDVDPRRSSRDPLQGGPRGRLARPLHARAGARGHLRRAACPTSRRPQILTVGQAVDFVLANDPTGAERTGDRDRDRRA